MEHFTPISASIGGALIGLSALIMWLGLGRVAGVSGMLGGLLPPRGTSNLWRSGFLIGLPLGALGARVLTEGIGALDVTPRLEGGLLAIIVAGLLVGYGTRLGSGCTSGHGICGLARLSARSGVAVVIFFVTAVVTVFVVRHVLS